VSGLSFDVEAGEVFGFLGPNGAGKTTTVKLLTGLLRPDEGSCSVFGFSPAQKPCEVHRLCGVMTEGAKMYGQMTGTENLIFFGQAFGMKDEDCRDRARGLLKKLDLWDARDRKLRAYSTGMAQRLSLARALMNRPRALFLDEPTSGLDPESAREVNTMIADLARAEDVTVFLCTHQLRYAQDVCSRYGILEKGSLLAYGTLEAISRDAGLHMRASLRLREGDSPAGFERGGDGWWYADVLSEDEMPKLIREAVTGGHEIYEARLIRPTLEDVYFKYVSLNGGKQP
jgi:ABC-2 type transport system ATP-binding protein